MSEERWAAHGGSSACDSCHSRKVKCNRKDPCQKCILGKKQCLRDRHKQPPRLKTRADDKINALVTRLSTLEQSVLMGQANSGVLPVVLSTHISPAPPSEIASSNGLLKRKRRAHTDTQKSIRTPDSDAQANEARSLIQKELSLNHFLSENQRSVLSSAVSFVDQVSQQHAATSEVRGSWRRDEGIEPNLTPGEIVHVLSGVQARESDSSGRLWILDHIPPRAFERIALGLLESTADEQTILLYKVLVHFKTAAFYLGSQMQGSLSPAVRARVTEMQFYHRRAALSALDRVSFLTQPSLLLLQALIAGAMLMQVVGDPISCWSLTASASRTLVALGYHNIRETLTENETDEEIHAVVAWCCEMDRCMSMVLVRPMSLPPLHVPFAALIKSKSSNPMAIFMALSMEMVPVQERILDMTLESASKDECRSKGSIEQNVAVLRRQMLEIFGKLEKIRPPSAAESDTGALLHWQILEFRYFCTLTSVHRLSPTVISSTFEREECLRCARKALECVQQMQINGSEEGHFAGEYNPYLCWTVLSYPLCPFFVVFCNVVGTSNAADFQMLQSVTDWIASFASTNTHVSQLRKLCVTLLGLCRPLMEITRRTTTNDNKNAPSTNLHFQIRVPGVLPPESNVDLAVNLDPTQLPPDGNVSSAPDFNFWDDSMMMQLFQAQPNLNWFSNADMFDPALHVHDP